MCFPGTGRGNEKNPLFSAKKTGFSESNIWKGKKIDRQTETALVKKFQDDGSAEAFEELVKGHLPRVRRIMYSMTLNEADADDLAQEVFISVYRNLHRFRNESSFSTWVYRISVNTAGSYLRRKPAERNNSEDYLSKIPGNPESRPEISLSAGETDRAVADALGELPEDLRTAIVLTAIEGLTCDEAARAANCAKPVLYWRVHRARKLLKRKLKDYL